MASELSLPRPRTALALLREAIIPADAPNDASIQLIITVNDASVNIREFSAYLSLIDKTYGRLSPQGLASYSQTPYAQLPVSFRQGSLEVIISELLSHIDSVTVIIILRYLLKYLPTGLKDVAAAYHDYQEGMLVRERRKQLREEVKQDQELAVLDNNRKNEIVALLDMLYWHERRQLPAAQRFAVKYVQKVILKLVHRDDPKNRIQKLPMPS
jgi:hypothetical protein